MVTVIGKEDNKKVPRVIDPGDDCFIYFLILRSIS